MKIENAKPVLVFARKAIDKQCVGFCAVDQINLLSRLREDSGLSAKTRIAAALALPNTWFSVQVLYQTEVIGMGRIIGDGGCHFQVVDIAVLPDHRGNGLGKQIMSVLMEYYEANAPESAYISLIADGKAKDLYTQFGFSPTAPVLIGMSG